MPAYEKKKVTVTLTVTVTGSGRIGEFTDAVTDHIRASTGSQWETSDGWLRVSDLQFTEVHCERG